MRAWGSALLMLCLAQPAWAGQKFNPFTGKPDFCGTVQEQDGSPSFTSCQIFQVENGTMTDNGDGTFLYTAPAGSGGDNITVNGTAATNANFKDGDIDFTIDTAAAPDDITATVACANCVALGTETSGNYADGDAPAGSATSGDSATNFFSTGTLGVSIGGTGAGSFTTNGVLYGNNVSALQVTAQGAANSVLTANAGAPSFSASPTVTSVTATSTVTGQTAISGAALQVGSDYITDITGANLSVVNGALTATGGGGSGDITDVYNCASGDCASISMADGDLLDASAVNPTSTTEGIILPQNTTCTANTAEGQACWDTDDDALRIGNGTTTTSFGADTNAVREYWFSAAAMLPLEAADSIPPLTKTTGTNVDVYSISYDASTDEGRQIHVKVPSDVQTGSTITFRIVWFSLTATTGNVIWDVRHQSTGAQGEVVDAALTTLAASAAAVQGTVQQRTVTTVTQTLANLGWAANDDVYIMIYRDADNASDTMAGDAEVIGVGVEIPRA